MNVDIFPRMVNGSKGFAKKLVKATLATYCMNGIREFSSSEAVRQIISLTCLEAKVNEDH